MGGLATAETSALRDGALPDAGLLTSWGTCKNEEEAKRVGKAPAGMCAGWSLRAWPPGRGWGGWRGRSGPGAALGQEERPWRWGPSQDEAVRWGGRVPLLGQALTVVPPESLSSPPWRVRPSLCKRRSDEPLGCACPQLCGHRHVAGIRVQARSPPAAHGRVLGLRHGAGAAQPGHGGLVPSGGHSQGPAPSARGDGSGSSAASTSGTAS